MDQQHAPLIGIVGGIGSGKSSVARWLAEHCGGRLIDADVVGHQVLLREEVQRDLHREFGDAVFAGGRIDRRRLGELVFGDRPEQVAARLTLEQIVHPVMGEIIKEEIVAARSSEDVRLIVLDAAILLETGWRAHCDLVVFVDVPRDERLRRVASARGWSDDELTRREASQWPLESKRRQADIVIDNSLTVEAAGRQLVEQLIARGWLAPPPHDAGRLCRELDHSFRN